jgi:PTH2 family peptidyl-tRNA hydrolase
MYSKGYANVSKRNDTEAHRILVKRVYKPVQQIQIMLHMLHKGEIKQAIIIRSDLEMSKGKAVAQGAHASLMGFFEAERADRNVTKKWLEQGEKKIVLKTESEESLIKLYNAFKYKKVPCALVADAGLTELPPGTKTALGVGPWMSEELDDITGRLKLF